MNGDNDDACTDLCNTPSCGDAFVQASLGEQCDAGAENSDAGACTGSCQNAQCGDGLTQDGVESCDDGMNNADNAACKSDCALNVCGDGDLHEGIEGCDDGNPNDNDACTNTCVPAKCGDGFVQPGEECDAGPANDDIGLCKLNCTDAVCDDGNKIDNDACSNACKLPQNACPNGAVLHQGYCWVIAVGCESQASRCQSLGMTPTATALDGVNWSLETQQALCIGFGCTAIGINNCCANSGWYDAVNNQLYAHSFNANQYYNYGCWNADRPLYTCNIP